MSTKSFDKAFAVTDPKAIEQLLSDIQQHKPQRNEPVKRMKEQPSVEHALQILKQRLASK
ncbi:MULTISPECIES: hypothetical protein [unclassified Acinetobacter]|uniref:hypothetical protein n=1 Tax=unclassified Acinetobacter TaxID=196816 RepID=UPI0035B6CCD0